MADFPSTSSAYGKWSLKDVRDARMGDNWPKIVSAPDAPTGVSAVAGNQQATVSFTAPAYDGGSTITGYRVTSSPGSLTATGSSSPITITGLTNDTSYTFTVAAENAIGYGPESEASSPVTPQFLAPSTVEYLVVAGGGAGGWAGNGGGGGGAGGALTASGYSVTSGSAITVTVGSGGSSWTNRYSAGGYNGNESVFGSITAAGGGYGSSANSGTGYGSPGGNGGSGGGGAQRNNPAGGSGISGQGYAGGNGSPNSGADAGGGGGGKGGVGQGAIGSAQGGNGGAAFEWPSGSGTYYAGGGGGAGGSSDTYGLGGGTSTTSQKGGGGDGEGGPAGKNGVANTGGGAGGKNDSSNGIGGSGVVIIRYSDSFTPAASTSGSPTYTVSGGYRYYKFTGSGSITF